MLLTALVASGSRATEPETLWEEIGATRLDTSRAVNVSGLKLQAEGHEVLYRNIWIEELDLKDPDTDF